TVTNTVTANVSGVGITVASLQVSALELVGASGRTADAQATGLVGGLIGIDATITKAKSQNSVSAGIGAGSVINASRVVGVGARNDSAQYAASTSVAFGIAAAGATKADAMSAGACTSATVGSGATINAGSVNVVAGGTDDNFAAGTPGSVGALAIAAAELNTDSTDTQTKAEIGNGAHITVTRAATQMSGESVADFNAFQGVA